MLHGNVDIHLRNVCQRSGFSRITSPFSIGGFFPAASFSIHTPFALPLLSSPLMFPPWVRMHTHSLCIWNSNVAQCLRHARVAFMFLEASMGRSLFHPEFLCPPFCHSQNLSDRPFTRTRLIITPVFIVNMKTHRGQPRNSSGIAAKSVTVCMQARVTMVLDLSGRNVMQSRERSV
jgi:hypothetical protein